MDCGDYIDKSGKIIIKPQFDGAKPFQSRRAAVETGGRWGYVNHDGLYRVNPTFADAASYENNYALTAYKLGKDGWGIINDKGEYIMRPDFDDGLPFSDGLAAVKDDELWGFIDSKGRIAVNPQYESALSFSEGLAPVRSGGKWGYINKEGRVVIPFQYDNAGIFSGGFAAVKTPEYLQYIDNSGKVRYQIQIIQDNGSTVKAQTLNLQGKKPWQEYAIPLWENSDMSGGFRDMTLHSFGALDSLIELHQNLVKITYRVNVNFNMGATVNTNTNSASWAKVTEEELRFKDRAFSDTPYYTMVNPRIISDGTFIYIFGLGSRAGVRDKVYLYCFKYGLNGGAKLVSVPEIRCITNIQNNRTNITFDYKDNDGHYYYLEPFMYELAGLGGKKGLDANASYSVKLLLTLVEGQNRWIVSYGCNPDNVSQVRILNFRKDEKSGLPTLEDYKIKFYNESNRTAEVITLPGLQKCTIYGAGSSLTNEDTVDPLNFKINLKKSLISEIGVSGEYYVIRENITNGQGNTSALPAETLPLLPGFRDG